MEQIKKFCKSRELLTGLLGLVIGLGLGILLCAPWNRAAAEMPNLEATVSTQPGTTAATQTPTTMAPTVPTATLPTLPIGPQPLQHHITPNHFREEDFVADENGYITCLEVESWLGVDVSAHQRSIDWQKVADAGVKFAMIRIAYRGWGSTGNLLADNYGVANLDGAAAAGLQTGVYVFSQAITVEEAIEEARFALTLLDGRALDLPVVFDWETISSEDARTNGLDNETLNACAMAFCQEIEAGGYKPMVYFNQKMAKYQYDLTAFQKAGYDFWLAMYKESMTFAHHVQMWQYTSSGSVPGINGKVDLDLYFPGG